MANEIKLTFAGDATSLERAAQKSEQSVKSFGDAADKSGKQLSDTADSSKDLGSKMGHLGSSVSGAMDAFDSLSGGLRAVSDLQNAGAEKASKLARAFDDVRQAELDLQQATRDSSQASLDAEQAQLDVNQANLDAQQAQADYNDAVKKHGANSQEARQAAQDLAQAQYDVKQANEDSMQAQQDAAQAAQDATTAQHDLNDANREAHPPELQKWADNLEMITPLLSAVVGVIGLVTAAQWLWNTAVLANPITWIIVGIVALIAVIVLIATKTTWFQDIWSAVWGFLKGVAEWFAGPFAGFFVSAWDTITGAFKSAWQWIKDTVTSVVLWIHDKIDAIVSFVTGLPGRIRSAASGLWDGFKDAFRGALNWIIGKWNSLHFSIPGFDAFGVHIGGFSIGVPTIPKFHTGGIVSGAMGSETLAVLQAGERVTGGSNSAGGVVGVLRVEGSADSKLYALLHQASREGLLQFELVPG